MDTHKTCKINLASKRTQYQCAQNRIFTEKSVRSSGWNIYIEPFGLIGEFNGCCLVSATSNALDFKFGDSING